jgi:salicylic acid 3-hydroxylase
MVRRGGWIKPRRGEEARLAEVVSVGRIPVVDLACPDRAAVVCAIGDACRSHGFFQVNWPAERGPLLSPAKHVQHADHKKQFYCYSSTYRSSIDDIKSLSTFHVMKNCMQVVNHGIDAGLIAQLMAVAREFFRLPPEEKAKLYSDDPARKMRLSTSFNMRMETVHNWRDYLRLHCHPLDQFVPD